MKSKPGRLLLLLLLIFGFASAVGAQSTKNTGTVSGEVVEATSKEPIPGVTVILQGTKYGAFTEPDGSFTIKFVPAGEYTLVATSVGFDTVTVASLTVEAGEQKELSLELNSVVTQMDETVKVTGKKVENTEATVLLERRDAAAVSDGISAEQISQSGSSDAAEAVKQVVGASVVDGKYVYVRGLGGRYTNTQLNGSTLPSPDPDEQAVPMDLVPANLLDNIVVSKSFTPDKPGDFAGGAVDLSTRDYPARRTLVITTSTGYNSNTTFQSGILSHQSSGTDWLGYDDGRRAIPDIVVDNPNLQEEVPNARFMNVTQDGLPDTLPLINYIDQSAHAFNPEMQTSTRTAPLNQGYSLSFGDRWDLFDSPLGVIASLTYSRKVTSHEGVQGRYDRGSVNSDQLTPDYIFQDQQGKDEVLAGGLLTLKYGFHPNHSIGWTLMHNRNGESVSRYLEGPWFYYTNDPNAKVRNFVLSYTERALTSNQLNGSHKLFGGKIQADWQYSYSTTHQDDPDLRFFVDEVEQRQIEDNEGNLIDTTIYLIRLDRYMAPQRLYRELDETGRDYRLNFMVPITERTKFRTGYAHNVTQRTHKERRFEYQNTSAYARYNGDIDAFISDVGIDTVRTRVVQGDTVYQYIFTNFLKETTELRNQYTGDKRVTAAYAMIETPVFGPFSFIGGARYEHTHMFSLTESTSPTNHLGEINEKDWLPSLNLIYSVTPDIKVRASYGRTLARPTLREMTPAASVDWGTGDFFNGNADLKMTKIDNYDLRWEWFVRPGEVLSVSGFHKDIKNPIELSIVGDNNDIVVINSDKATVYGLELEARRRLDWVHSSLRNFSIGGNLTLAHSKVRIGDAELAELQGEYPDASEYREMSGQSPYLLNLDAGYNNYNSGTRVSVFYNVFGERFAYNSDHITPDVYEQARQQLDVMVAQRFFGNATLKLGVKNLLDADHEFVYEDRVANAATEVYERISPGRDFSLGLSYEVW